MAFGLTDYTIEHQVDGTYAVFADGGFVKGGFSQRTDAVSYARDKLDAEEVGNAGDAARDRANKWRNGIRAHLLSNASMDPVSLENLTAETARTLLIGIARDAQALTGLTHEQASTVVLQAAA